MQIYNFHARAAPMHLYICTNVCRFVCAFAACANRFKVDSIKGATYNILLTYKCIQTYVHTYNIYIYTHLYNKHTYVYVQHIQIISS